MGRINLSSDGYIHVVLSERNLLALLTKLYEPGSERTLMFGDRSENLLSVMVTAEEDDMHYASSSRRGTPPGRMHPRTEQTLRLLKEGVQDEP